MGETANIAEIASIISKEIFKYFGWAAHPLKDIDFKCVNEMHVGPGAKPMPTHPCDVVFSYGEPYLGKRIYLLTDLKSYAADSISHGKLRTALKSMCFTVECAKESEEWRTKYSIYSSEAHEVRGMLFVHNHDGGYEKSFADAIDKVDLQTLPVAAGSIIHFFGPQDINRLYSTCNDIARMQNAGELPKEYTFYYPDLVMRRRQGDVWEQPATIESLTGPFVIIKHAKADNCSSGYVIYYNRPGKSVEEFEYFLDSLSRFQMLDSGEKIRIRVVDKDVNSDLKSVFDVAVNKYVKAWGFDVDRENILKKIEIKRVTSVANNYNPGETGWGK